MESLKVFNRCVDVALETWFNGGSAVGINDLFQTKQYYHYMERKHLKGAQIFGISQSPKPEIVLLSERSQRFISK